MAGFDGNILQNMPMGLISLVDMASPAARMPLDFAVMPGAADGQLSFPDIFRQVGALSGDLSMEKFEDVIKNASNVDFSTPEMNKASGKQPDFFVDAAGKLTKNPKSQSKPGAPLNIEIQSNGSELMNQLQQSAIQSILDTFLSKHPGLASFPHSWQEVLDLLSRAISGNTASASSDADSASYANPGSSGAADSSAGDSGSGGGAGDSSAAVRSSSGDPGIGSGAGSAPIRPESGLAPPVVVEGKAFPVAGYKGGPLGLHHGTSDGAADIMAPAGTPILAMEGGTVEKVGSDGAGGNTITIRQADGTLAYYAHMQAAAAKQDGTPLKAGDTNTMGEMIGRVGNTGNAAHTASHLHLGVGDEIQNGTGGEGGAGTNFDLTDTLNAILSARNV